MNDEALLVTLLAVIAAFVGVVLAMTLWLKRKTNPPGVRVQRRERRKGGGA